MNISTDTLQALRNGSVDADALRLEGLPLPAERVVKGDARVGVVELVEHNGVSIGVWEITPSVSTDVEVNEVFVVLSGAAEVTFADGSPPLTLRPGTVGRLAAGAHTTWHVTETFARSTSPEASTRRRRIAGCHHSCGRRKHMSVRQNYIGGAWRLASDGGTRSILNPANGGVLAEVAESGVAEARAAIAAAKKAFYVDGTWRRMPAARRADFLFKVADKLMAKLEELAVLDSQDNGKPLREARCDIEDAAACFRYYAGLITKPQGGVYEVSDAFGPMHAYSMHEPVGVCALITPWNYPLLMATWKLAPALAAGNCVVFKPSELTPLSAVALFEIFDELGLPPGTANLVLGPGPTVGNELASSVDVDMITFTGSTRTGQSIATAAVGNLKKVGLELGGKSPNIIFADADLEGAVEWAMIGVFFNQGQVCSAGSRILIEESLKERFVARLVERADAMTIGEGLGDPDIGPLVSEGQMTKVLEHVERAREQGAVVLCGGSRVVDGELAKGYYVRPTVIDGCTPDMDIVREEVFGPVVSIQTFRTEAEAVAMANDTRYGLAGGVFTSDGARALRVIKEVRAGITWVNCYNPTFNEAPWGGYKMSGYGRELGVNGLLEYQQVKQVNINLQPGTVGWYPER